ncbi:MAG: hypothetical protein M0042_01660 [Nitrospiraceae bacterium]|nr:hypothetical protein [Nitrospiraceae bacterium]
MRDPKGELSRFIEPLVFPSLLSAFLVATVPQDAWALQVGCFFTAILLGIMFFVGIGFTLLFKHLLSRHLAHLLKTPWKRIVGLTALEFLLLILVFALTPSNILVTLLVYLPLAFLVNCRLLATFVPVCSQVISAPKRLAFFALESLSLPAAIQLSGLIWTVITNLLSFTELKM